MLIALAQHPAGLTRKKLRIHSGYADSGPTSKAMAAIIEAGWVALDGEKLVIGSAGLAALGPFDPLPTGAALLKHILDGNRLKPAAKKMLKVICEAFPAPISRTEIRERSGYADSGPTSKALAHLVKLDYVTVYGRDLRAADELFDPPTRMRHG